MKLVFIRQRFNPFGGAETHLRALIKSLASQGHRITVVAESWSYGAGFSPSQLGIRLVKLGAGSGFKYHRLRSFCRAASAWLTEEGKDRDAALAVDRIPGIEVFWTAEGCHAAWLEARSGHVSPIKRLSFRINPLHRTHLALEREMFSHPDLRLVLANSGLVRDDLLKHYSLNPELITVSTSGVDPQRVIPAEPNEARARFRAEEGLGELPLILFVGSGFKRKGLRYAIEALGLMENSAAVLVAVGGDRPGPYRKLASARGVGSRVRLLGTRADVPDLLAAADVFVLPTIYDPGAISCLEALVAGLPVVTTSTNGSAEFIEPGRNGFVVDRADDRAGLARALDAALNLGRLEANRTAVPTVGEQVEEVLAHLQWIARGRTV